MADVLDLMATVDDTDRCAVHKLERRICMYRLGQRHTYFYDELMHHIGCEIIRMLSKRVH
jgi:hypothetical protein